MSCFAVFALSHLLQVSVSQAALFQSPPVQTVRVGSRATLNCSRDVGALAFISWYKQSDRGHLQFLYRMGRFVGPDGRFSGIVDEESANYTLVIENVQLNDSGIYFCAAHLYSEFGNGSKLVVTADPPTIFLLAPPVDEIPQMKLVPLMCLVRGASSESLLIRWNVSGNISEGVVDPPTFDPDGSYSVRSRFHISAETWRSGAVCTCTAGDLVSDRVAVQKDDLQPCHIIFFSLVPTLLLLFLGATAVAITKGREKRQAGNPETFGKIINSRRKNPGHDTYAQLAIGNN
ncbi:uncharacterized protein LOC127587543 [Pristis pectinata]|uniref:uncharacterized protein LOC127587543 n=1 Tax=Pristis pectinata TaxID=685728 RepID=UPI00223CD5F2|nr:uncharacterized protein LOC127587543 [Pristis pectinata]